MDCRHCGDVVSKERVDAGYDYCMQEKCVEACLRPLHVVAVAVNKSNDQLVLREQLDIPRVSSSARADGGQYGAPRRPLRREPRVLTDGQKIARACVKSWSSDSSLVRTRSSGPNLLTRITLAFVA